MTPIEDFLNGNRFTHEDGKLLFIDEETGKTEEGVIYWHDMRDYYFLSEEKEGNFYNKQLDFEPTHAIEL